jgi:hypothetical protein
MWVKILVLLGCVSWSLSALATDVIDLNKSTAGPCEFEGSKSVSFINVASDDVLKVRVSGNPCSKAKLWITVLTKDQNEVYRYESNFIEHMPFLIYEPELNGLVEFFVAKVLSSAISRTTQDLPEYTNVDDYYELTNDFVIVPPAEYEALRQVPQPILWHITGDTSWVHWIYDEKKSGSKLLMRGGVFK